LRKAGGEKKGKKSFFGPLRQVGGKEEGSHPVEPGGGQGAPTSSHRIEGRGDSVEYLPERRGEEVVSRLLRGNPFPLS